MQAAMTLSCAKARALGQLQQQLQQQLVQQALSDGLYGSHLSCHL